MSGPRDLTPSQWEAVEHFEGPLLILAGPGSGKTRVVTRRIARLIERDVDPRSILAITFTNKAASEMASRVADLLPGTWVWVSTFHRFCARLLRSQGPTVGLQPNFTILDKSDQRQLLRDVLSDLDLDPVHYPPARIADRISRAKNKLHTPERFAQFHEETAGDHVQAIVAQVYPQYQRRLLESNAVDFDDLLMHVALLLEDYPELRSDLDRRFRYVLVDEYQDTNSAQYRIVAALSQDYPNLCVTGDPDQSIYGWRGAQIENILRFEADYPSARVILLEQNFRSTKRILEAADTLIAKNVHRKAKALVTENPEGVPVELLGFQDGKHEADAMACRIRERVDAGECKWSDFAIFYRVNALSRPIELALSRYRIPYMVAAGVAFYERTEVKDLLAYLRLIYNPADRAAFLRIVNKPLRGIGKKTVSQLRDWADHQGINLLEAAHRAKDIPAIKKQPAVRLQAFARMLENFSLADAGSVAGLLETIIQKTGYTRGWGDTQSEQTRQRLANVEELLTAAQQFDARSDDEATLEGFLESACLADDLENVDPSAGKVTLMTLHAAKGLEFPIVYIIAVEEGLIPHERAVARDDLRELEEERRLLFVGMTRAEHALYLTQTEKRDFRGRTLHTIPSSFLYELGLARQEQDKPALFPDPPPQTDEVSIHSPDTESSSAEESKASFQPKLTTAAHLLDGTMRAAELPQGFAVGMQVRHPRYGLGTVVGVSGFAKRRTLTVEFDNGQGSQTFMAHKCPLQPVGMR